MVVLKFLFREKEPVVDDKFEQIMVTVPTTAAAGDRIHVPNPHLPGTTFTVEIPLGKLPGKSFPIKIPRCPKEIKVVVPEMYKNGDSIPVEHPGRPSESFTVKVPQGLACGSTFKVALP